MDSSQELDSLKEENSKLKEELLKLKSKTESGDTDGLDMLEMSCKMASLESELAEARTKPDHSVELEAVKAELVKLQEDELAHAQEIDKLKQENEEAKKTAQFHREKLEVVEYDLQTAKSRDAEKQQTVTDLSQKLEASSAQLAELQARSESAIKEKQNALDEMKKASAMLNHTKEKLEQRDKEIEALNAKLSEARFERQQDSQRLQSELAQLRLQQQLAQSSNEEITKLQKKLNDLDSEKTALNRMVEKKEAEIHTLTVENANQQEEFKKLNDKLSTEQTKIEELTQERDTLKSTFEKLREKSIIDEDTLTKRLEETMSLLQAANDKIANQATVMQNLGDIEQLRSIIRDKDQQIDIDDKTKQAQKVQVDNLTTTIKKMEEEKKSMSNQINVKSTLETQLRMQVQEGESKIAHLQQQVKGFETTAHTLQADLRKKCADVESLSAEIKKTSQEDMVPRVELMKAKDQTIRAEQQLTLQSQNIAQLTKQINAITKEKRELQMNYDALLVLHESVKSKVQKIELPAQDAAVHSSSNMEKEETPKNIKKGKSNKESAKGNSRKSTSKEPRPEPEIFDNDHSAKKSKVTFDHEALKGAKTKASLLRNLNNAEKQAASKSQSKTSPKRKTMNEPVSVMAVVGGRSKRKASLDARDTMLARTIQYLSPMSKTLGIHDWDEMDAGKVDTSKSPELASSSKVSKKKDVRKVTKKVEAPIHEEVQSSPEPVEPEPPAKKGKLNLKSKNKKMVSKAKAANKQDLKEKKTEKKIIEVPKEEQVKEPPKAKGGKKNTFKETEPVPPLKTDTPLTRTTRRSARK